jgi:hypothetical protein
LLAFLSLPFDMHTLSPGARTHARSRAHKQHIKHHSICLWPHVSVGAKPTPRREGRYVDGEANHSTSYTRTCACTHTHTYAHTTTWVIVATRTRDDSLFLLCSRTTHTHTPTRPHTHTPTHTHPHPHPHTHTHTHTHTHIHRISHRTRARWGRSWGRC